MAKQQYSIGIVGAGLGGLAAAIGISRAGHKVTILEQAPMLGEVGAGIQVPPNSSRIMKRWGILDQLEAVAVRPNNFILREYRKGDVLNTMNVLPTIETKYQAPYLHIHRADYHKILVAEAERVGTKIELDSTVTGMEFETGIIRRKDKPDLKFDLVIGADGLKSICRESLLGRADPPHLTGDFAYRAIVKVSDMRKNPLLKEFADTPNINYWMGPDSHVVVYLLQGGELCNIVLINPDNLPENVNMQKADLQEMRDYFTKWDPRLKALLETVQDTAKWRLQNSEEMKTWSHPSGKFALMGDACHATLPYLAQGAAQAVEDGAVLGHLFEKLEKKSQLTDIFVIYEQIRKARTTRVVKGSTGYRDIFHMPDGPRQQERDRQMLEEEPFEGFPNRWADPVFQQFLFGYDAKEEVEKAWKVYKDGKFPGTMGRFSPNL